MPPRSSSKRAAAGTPSRQSKRAKAAAKKSYLEPDSDDGINPKASSSGDQYESKESEYEVQSGKDLSSESDHEELLSEDDSKPAKATPRGRNAKRTVLPLHKKQDDEEELWKHGAKLTPGTQVIIKRPKAREAGDTPYTDETIHPNTMLFLKDLAAHNDRTWLKGRRFPCFLQLQDLCPISGLSSTILGSQCYSRG